jgi:hypothetical protein
VASAYWRLRLASTLDLPSMSGSLAILTAMRPRFVARKQFSRSSSRERGGTRPANLRRSYSTFSSKTTAVVGFTW